MTVETHLFEKRSTIALDNPILRRNFTRAMTGLRQKRAAQFPDPQEYQSTRNRGSSIRARSLAKLPDLLELLEKNLTKNGIIVHWAETIEEGNQIILDILMKAKAKSLVKGKSMVTEEMHLNHFLEKNGIEARESDLGEYIIQLAEQAPSHIVMPCIHMNKSEISELFAEKIPNQAYTEDVDELTATARRVLRKSFAEADAGISGVNFAVAETGTLVLIENEGNGRLSTTLPKLHIAVTGIEKVVETLEDVAPLLSLLPRSATGQIITSYVNMISRPRQSNEKDGPQEVHLLLLDNGRSRIYDDLELGDTLKCIRCAACMNHCPVYTRVGGHSYSFVYPGPIGKILSPQIEGLDISGDQPHASSLCNACVEVCPVKIPITDILVRLRHEGVNGTSKAVKGSGSEHRLLEDMSWWSWRLIYASPLLYKFISKLLGIVGNYIPSFLPPLNHWTKSRSPLIFKKQTLHALVKKRGLADV